jgi:hypothetical protein
VDVTAYLRPRVTPSTIRRMKRNHLLADEEVSTIAWVRVVLYRSLNEPGWSVVLVEVKVGICGRESCVRERSREVFESTVGESSFEASDERLGGQRLSCEINTRCR